MFQLFITGVAAKVLPCLGGGGAKSFEKMTFNAHLSNHAIMNN